MNYKCTLNMYLLIAMLLIPAHGQASIKDDFSKGIQSFKSEHYSQAIKYFELAQKQGLKSASLYFNLGSTYYNLNEFKKSEFYFKRLRSYPSMRYLAEYNLGLINRKLNNKKMAEIWFGAVAEKSTDKKLAALAKKQLKRKAKKQKRKEKSWNAYASAAFGNDSNINAAPSGVALNQADSFMTISANGNYLFNGDKTNGWLAGADFYHIDYFDFNINNETRYGIAIKNNRKLGNWKTRFSGKLYKNTFSGDDYQTTLLLEAYGKYSLSKENRLKLRYRYYDITSDNIIYDYLEGSKQQFRVEYKHYNKNNKQRFYYELELNDRQDTATSSFSPKRNTLRAIHTEKVNKEIQWGGDVLYRASNYPTVALQNRDDERWKYGVFAIYRFDKSMKLKAKYTHIDNSSNINSYDYDKDLFSVTLSKIW